jgi:hypothetical protein
MTVCCQVTSEKVDKGENSNINASQDSVTDDTVNGIPTASSVFIVTKFDLVK